MLVLESPGCLLLLDGLSPEFLRPSPQEGRSHTRSVQCSECRQHQICSPELRTAPVICRGISHLPHMLYRNDSIVIVIHIYGARRVGTNCHYAMVPLSALRK